MGDRRVSGQSKETGYVPAGEQASPDATFTLDQVATAFKVDRARVARAWSGEFGLGPDRAIDSRQAQQLAEALLADQPLDRREAALMTLGAFTPRPDQAWGLGEKPPGEESDRLRTEAGDDR